MIARWMRRLIWEPYERACRVRPLWPFRAVVTEPADGVRYIRIDTPRFQLEVVDMPGHARRRRARWPS
jgi:hypothetical protein